MPPGAAPPAQGLLNPRCASAAALPCCCAKAAAREEGRPKEEDEEEEDEDEAEAAAAPAARGSMSHERAAIGDPNSRSRKGVPGAAAGGRPSCCAIFVG